MVVVVGKGVVGEEQWFGPGEKAHPCCEKVFVCVVWTETGPWNVGMKFWNEGTTKKGWVGATRVRKVETEW